MSGTAPSPSIVDPASNGVSRTPWWCRAPILTAVIFAAIVLNNAEFLFHSHYYEADDYAANSLQVLEARQFRETLGNYSRFGFHHPGPAFFYLFAWGEIFFFDLTHLVPTPFNGQLIALYALSAFFFSASLAVIAARLGGAAPWFIGLGSFLAAWHFGAVGNYLEYVPGDFGLFSPWPPVFIVLPFLCFLVAAASVAAGHGRDLTLLTLAGCFLVHGHVAMPLFVVPLTLVAYGALWLETRRSGRRPWHLFPGQHCLAAATLAVFLLPIAIDLLTARPSNLERIIEHLGTSYGEGKGALQSLFYFLHFAAYAGYPSRWPIPTFETFDAAGLLSFFLLHWRVYACWLGSIVLLATMRWTEARRASEPPQIQKFRRRLYLILFLATGLSLIWGTLQEGPMYDYNSLFNFSIYYGWLLIVSLTAAVWTESRFSLWRAQAHSPTGGRVAARIQIASLIAITLAAAAAFAHERRRFRATPDHEQQRLFAASVDRGLALDPNEPKYLNFDWQANHQATRLAVYLERRGIPWWVREDWPLQFGEERIIRAGKLNQPVPTPSSSFWRAALHANAVNESDPRAIVLPLTPEVDLVIYPGQK